MTETWNGEDGPVSWDGQAFATVAAEAPVYTMQDVIRLKQAMAAAGPTGQVRYSDGSGVTYRPLGECVALLELMMVDVRRANAATAALDPKTAPLRAFRGTMRSGY